MDQCGESPNILRFCLESIQVELSLLNPLEEAGEGFSEALRLFKAVNDKVAGRNIAGARAALRTTVLNNADLSDAYERYKLPYIRMAAAHTRG